MDFSAVRGILSTVLQSSLTVLVYEENASWAKLAARLSSGALFRLSKLILLCVEPDVNVDIVVSRFSTMKERRLMF